MDFLKNVQNWDNHRPLLWWALQQTESSSLPVCEMGCGEGSTPYLQSYCKASGRPLVSYDYNQEWASRYGANYVSDWNSIRHPQYSVVLIDHSPGERRWIDIQLLADMADYIVIHDSEPAATGYMLDRIWHLFPHRRNLITPGAWATIVSRRHHIPEIQVDGFEIS